jgi:hypothetical protein
MAAKGGLSAELVQICWDWLSCRLTEVLELFNRYPLLSFVGSTRYIFTGEALDDICVRNSETGLEVTFLGSDARYPRQTCALHAARSLMEI